MSPRAKKTLIVTSVVLGVLLVVCVVCGASGWARFQVWADSARAEGERTTAEADQFAAGRDQSACLDEGLRRDDACGQNAVMCEAQVGVFTQRCLDQAAPVVGFCTGVPPTTEIMQSVRWGIERCTALGREGSQPCGRLMQTVQRHCEAHATP